MEEFIKVHRECIVGMLSGFDRVVFRGTLRSISYVDGLGKYMNSQGILLKDFDGWAQRCTGRLCRAVEGYAQRLGRPVVYMASSAASKEERALAVARQDGIKSGLVCVLSCVEPCMSPEIHRNREHKRLELSYVKRKCKFYYIYRIDPVFGWMHLRIQSWIPFEVQVCLNGREYLKNRLDKARIGYQKQDNCFTGIDDFKKAQGFLDQMVDLNWPRVLGGMLQGFWPKEQAGVLPEGMGRYYWSIRQSEVATDVLFKDKSSLEKVYPRLCRHAIEGLSCQDVLRFFDRDSSRYRGQVTSSCQKLVQGVRLKHQMGSNWVKMYDKAERVLRIETTINDPRMLRVFRGTLEQPEKDLKWRSMAKSVADIRRRVEVSRQANERYLGALAAVGDPVVTCSVLDPLSKPVIRGPRRCRGLRPVSPDDAALFSAVMDGRHLIDGMTNGSLQAILYGDPCGPEEAARRSGRTGRQLRMLRQHGLVQKIGSRRLYRVTAKGQRVMGLALAVRQTTNVLSIAA
jgi:hypothetical protein